MTSCALLQVQQPHLSHLLLVASFKPSIGKFCLELPAGSMVAHETAQDAAVRLVKEQTGFTASAPAGAAISPWTPQHPDLCPDTAKLVELVVAGQKAETGRVVAADTAVRPPPIAL